MRSLQILLLCAGLLMSGCAATSPARAPETGDPPGAAMLPDVSLSGLDPAAPPLRLSALRGKVVLVDFWATWCAPCMQILPYYSELQDSLGPRGLVVVGVNVNERDDDVRALLARMPLSFRIVRDPNGDLARRMGVSAMPTSFLVDRQGRVRDELQEPAPADRERLRARVQALLEEEP